MIMKLLVEKANAYCLLCTDPKRVDIDKNLIDRCEKYISDFSKFKCIKIHLGYLSQGRKKEKKV